MVTSHVVKLFLWLLAAKLGLRDVNAPLGGQFTVNVFEEVHQLM